MKPKPLVALNHLTVPIFILVPFRASAVVWRFYSPHHRSSMFRKKLVCASRLNPERKPRPSAETRSAEYGRQLGLFQDRACCEAFAADGNARCFLENCR